MNDVPLVERDQHLSRLRQWVDDLDVCAGNFVTVLGAAGSGKSRVLTEARRIAERQGVRVIAARASRLESTHTLGVVRQLFEPLLTRARASEREAWLSGPAGPAVSVLRRHEAGEETYGDFALLDGLFWLLANVCEAGPVFLQVDDLHWADESSLRFLAYLLPRVEGLPLLVAVGSRPVPTSEQTSLLDLILADGASQVLELGPLSRAGVAAVLRDVLGREPEPGFTEACLTLTGGNPLLVTESARATAAGGMAPTAGNAPRLQDIGSRALTRRVGLELALLPAAHVGVAEAVAALGPHATLAHLTALAGVTRVEALEATTVLERASILERPTGSWLHQRFDFVHPLVGAAVYDRMDRARTKALHTAAVRLLTEAGASAEEVAAHLLRLQPPEGAGAVETLRQAASAALSRGAPQNAHGYLKHTLTMPLAEDERFAVTVDAALAAVHFDLKAAVDHVMAAVAMAQDPHTRADLVATAGMAMLYAGKGGEGATLARELSDALPDELSDEEDELRRRLETVVVSAAVTVPGARLSEDRLERLRNLPPADTLGAAILDGAIALHDMHHGDPRGPALARRAVANPAARVARPTEARGLAGPLYTLLYADIDEGMAAVNEAMAAAQRHGSAAMLSFHHYIRGCGWLLRGDLGEAVAELREGLGIARLTHTGLLLPRATALLAEAVLEQDGPQAAARILDGFDTARPQSETLQHIWQSRALIWRAEHRFDEALGAALEAGRSYEAVGGRNPAVVAWRSEAALCLHALGRAEEAWEYAAAEIELARRWGAPRPLGRALRAAGVVRGGPEGVDLLRESLQVLAPSVARLEHARTLISLGSALRRANARREGIALIGTGREQAFRCGARPLAMAATEELRATGTRPRPLTLTGPESLTPSERRVAKLAGEGGSNREIAQRLFITVKTVEVHLSNVYRKLGISGRDQLHAHMEDVPAAG
ncbi:AAA family ATPase [Sphaerisporangium sp. B11E5]|uniref:helix-turn-helix transcriptional regulator n=1 Tax=Sphaerisporangium sp. B11E5 TaxID=3153563 RepID=UPI00325F4739